MPLRCAWAVHPSHCLCAGETLPMWKPTTGEPYAGEPHVRFGGRGRATPLPDPYRAKGSSVSCAELGQRLSRLRWCQRCDCSVASRCSNLPTRRMPRRSFLP